ncbi:cytochrome p450 [Apiospora marii]|uniref:cytochrome p450 n=1 Tax=Apiospora marii TaxID=335849 RepID=UPI00312F04B7
MAVEMADLPISGLGLPNLALLAVALGIAYYISWLAYNLFLHPLRAFPGPLHHRASNLPRAYYMTKGRLGLKVADLHVAYGPVVRIAPDELAFVSPQAWRDIYGHRAQGEPEFPKDPQMYRPIKDLPENIVSAQSREYHGALRRQLAHGFSERSMRAQEPIIGSYVDLLVHRLREVCSTESGNLDDPEAKKPRAVNMREWLNWCTFDVIGDLGFGEPFGCLESRSYHPWVRRITETIRFGGVVSALLSIGCGGLVLAMSRLGGMRSRDAHQRMTREKLVRRIELGAEGRPDFIEGLIRKKDELGMDLMTLQMNASLLIIAGSETTATLLSGATFLLLSNPDALAKLTNEVRSTFQDDADITLSSVGSLSYMLACLNESLRRYPPVVIGLPRLAPQGGAQVAGHFVPGGTRVAVWHYAASHDPTLWTDPMGFHPERFLGDARFAGDNLDAMQPFSLGPRNCIGKNLAYAEMRLILAKIVYNFDMRIADESRGWLVGQKAFTVWDKPPLQVYLTPVKK